MTTAASAVATATSQLGTAENPLGSNRTIYGEWYGHNGVAWCAIFISWVMAHIDKPSLRSAWCDTWIARAKDGSWGIWLDPWASLRPGDLAIFEWDGNPAHSDHIAMVWEVNGDGTWVSIEGNLGNRVSTVHRGRSNILGFVRPHYANATPTDVHTARPSSVQHYQAQLNIWLRDNNKPTLVVDGVYGPATRAALTSFQTFANAMNALAGNTNRISVDGIYGPQTAAALNWWVRAIQSPATKLPVPTGNPLLRVGSPSGDQVRAVQTLLNRAINTDLVIDGIYGQNTRRAVIYFQTANRLTADGIYGPDTARAIAQYA